MSQFAYNSDINGGSLMVRESRLIADLLLSGVSKDEWKTAIETNNLLQKRTPATAKRFSKAIRSRLECMAPEFWKTLKDGDEELAAQVVFACALQRNLLLVEFMEQVVKDAYASHADKIATYQWLEFLEDCSNKDPKIDTWQESTKKKMGTVVFRMLFEAGYLESTRSKKIRRTLIRPELKRMLEHTDKQRLLASMDMPR